MSHDPGDLILLIGDFLMKNARRWTVWATRISIAWLLSSVAAGSETAMMAESRPQFVHVEGQRLVAPGGGDFHIRAIGTGSTAADPSEKDYEQIARLKFNAVTVFLGYKHFYSEAQPDKYLGTGWRRLEQHLAFARKYGLRVILQMLEIEGAQFVPIRGEAFDYRIWVQPELQKRFIKLWEAIAQCYKDEPQILGYGLFAEPVTTGTRQQWINAYQSAEDQL